METVSLSSFNSIYFTSDMPDVAVSVPSGAVKSHVVMSCNGETFFDELLWPSDGIITLRELGELMEPLAQSHLVVSLTIQAQGMTEDNTEVGAPESSTSTVLFSRADVGTSAAEFYTSHFLSILQGDKVTSHGRLEYLWYYGQGDATVTAEYDDGTTGFFAALKSGGTSAYTQLDVSPDFYEVNGKQLVAYTVRAGNRTQRFVMDLDCPDCAPILEFYNSFGVWELIYCTGTHKVSPEYKRSSARFGGKLRNYRIEETRTFKADTGVLTMAMAAWADDLFRSDLVYVVNVVNGQVTNLDGGKEVVITDSKSELSNDDDELPRFTFSYRYAQRIQNVLQMNRVGRIFDNTFDHTFN